MPSFFTSMDIGSGQAKCVIADADFNCVYSKQIETLLGQHLIASGTNEIPEEALNKCTKALETFLTEAKKYNVEPQNIFAYCTEVFRKADNGPAYRRLIHKTLDLDMKILSQKSEAEIGFRTAKLVAKIPSSELLSWDTGGSSFQLKTESHGAFLVKLGASSASDAMRQEKGVETVENINPITPEIFQRTSVKLRNIIEEHHQFSIFKQELAKTDFKICAIGSNTNAFSILSKLVKDSNITLSALDSILPTLFKQPTSFFTSLNIPEPDLVLPKICLVKSVMESLKIHQVKFFEANGGCLGYLDQILASVTA